MPSYPCWGWQPRYVLLGLVGDHCISESLTLLRERGRYLLPALLGMNSMRKLLYMPFNSLFSRSETADQASTRYIESSMGHLRHSNAKEGVLGTFL